VIVRSVMRPDIGGRRRRIRRWGDNRIGDRACVRGCLGKRRWYTEAYSREKTNQKTYGVDRLLFVSAAH
jgi:hypothetical protein